MAPTRGTRDPCTARASHTLSPLATLRRVPATPSLAPAVLAGDRKALAAAITLVESTREQDQTAAETLLHELLPHAGRSLRIGITGAPGVGKSTLIEALGTRLCDAGHKVAVLAVDPSSQSTGGSILGDKTRMTNLSRDARAFVRPSPGGDTLGGVARRTREAMVCCEAAGFDVVLVETIGTGQSETAVERMVDVFLLLLSPAAGDELQGIKRGVMELADAIVVHKADGDLAAAANRAAQQCQLALRVLHSGEGELPPVLVASSTTGKGIDELRLAVDAIAAERRLDGRFQQERSAQAAAWMTAAVHDALHEDFDRHRDVARELPRLSKEVEAGRLLPHAAARALLALYRGASTGR